MSQTSIVLTANRPLTATNRQRQPAITQPLGQLADRWIALVTKRRAAGTADLYRAYILRFCEWLEEQGATLGGQVSPDHLTAWGQLCQARVTSGRYKASTLNNQLNAVRLFLRWLIAESAVYERVPQTNEPWITEARVKEWLSDVRDTSRPTRKKLAPSKEEVEHMRSIVSDPRDLALFTFLAGSGLRVSECCAVRASDIEPRPDGAAIVHVINGKGGKNREVIIAAEVLKPIATWAVICGFTLGHEKDTRCLWIAHDSKRDEPISRIRVYQLIEQYRLKASIDHKVTPHNLRHYFGTEFYRSTRDPVNVANALGHSGLGYVQTYVKEIDAAEAEPFQPGWEKENNQ